MIFRMLAHRAVAIVGTLSLAWGCGAPDSAPRDGGVLDAPPARDAAVADAAPSGDASCAPGCAFTLPSFTVDNRSMRARTEVVRVTLPFPRGAAPDATALRGVSVEGVPAELVPLEWHYRSDTGARDSIALAQLRVPLTLEAGARRAFSPRVDGSTPPEHTFGPETAAWIGASGLAGARVHAVLSDGTVLKAPLFAPTFVALDAGRVTQTLRHRTHFSGPSGAHPLSLTTYATLDAGLDQGEVIVLVGNDTLEQPVSGGVAIERLEVLARAPFRFGLREPAAYGVTPPDAADDETWLLVSTPTNLGDGANLVFRGRWAVSPARSGPTYESFLAALDARLFPLATHDAWTASGAAGVTGFMPPLRGMDELRRAAVEPECTRAVVGTPVSHLGEINRAPPSTGDQPDFGSGLPRFALAAIETGLPCSLRTASLAVDREVLRPSFYWMRRGDAEDRVNSTDFPSLFFWSGRLHFDPSQNRGQPLWLPRIERDGFVPGEFHGWGPMDDQHYGNNAVRAVYELTGDPFLRDVLVAHQTLLTWMFFTGYAPSLGAQRSMRLMKEAVALYAVDDEGPAAGPMRDGAIAKNLLLLAEARARVSAGLSPAHGTVRNDGRVPLSVGPDGAPREVVMAWQTGFHMEYQALAVRNGWDATTAREVVSLYTERAADFFRDDGTPVTYFVAAEPDVLEVGGIGVTWWAGWMHVLELAGAPGRARLEAGRRTLCEALALPDGVAYDDRLRWASYDCP